ncbi:hypothetical protein N7539_000115 [Penicillium diatomitis]|uniref:Uncharacterized protein n=1 Tax=Penicillium diatomitis TaxID=2819901 RepID=A0A9W9XL61_9EURO|nr:uncharacterized protein N7539_000115 [Penicillium diatomitis]KAJ5494999.1 hypothetical protein N7539_000115 [Penicillium diatomitis]
MRLKPTSGASNIQARCISQRLLIKTSVELPIWRRPPRYNGTSHVLQSPWQLSYPVPPPSTETWPNQSQDKTNSLEYCYPSSGESTTFLLVVSTAPA